MVTLHDGERIQRWTRPGTIYSHCLDEQILGADNLFIRAPDSVAGLTRRRLRKWNGCSGYSSNYAALIKPGT